MPYTVAQLYNLGIKDFKQLRDNELRRVIKLIKAPPGWTKTVHTNKLLRTTLSPSEGWDSKSALSISLKLVVDDTNGRELMFRLIYPRWDDIEKLAEKYRVRAMTPTVSRLLVDISGTTSWKNNGKSYSFDTHGISDSFYIDQYNGDPITAEKIQATIDGQNERIDAALERQKSTSPLPAPLDKFHRTPAEVEKIKATLAKHGKVNFNPPGMGVGYSLTTKRVEQSRPVPELAKFFGVPALFMSTYDAD